MDKHKVIRSRLMQTASKCKPWCSRSGNGIEHFRERRSSPDAQDGSSQRRLQDLAETAIPCPGKRPPEGFIHCGCPLLRWGRSLVAGREQQCRLVDSLFTTLAPFSQNVAFQTA